MTLDEVRADAFRLLSRGVADRRSPFRLPAMATIGLDARPQVRTVVLRAFDAGARIVTVHSDIRAVKIAELRANPAVALHVWDDGAQVQVRLDGSMEILTGDAAQQDWLRLHAGSRASYATAQTPGTPLSDPPSPKLDDAGAFLNFAVLRMQVSGIDWLHLARDGQRRARFAWNGESLRQEWVGP